MPPPGPAIDIAPRKPKGYVFKVISQFKQPTNKQFILKNPLNESDHAVVGLTAFYFDIYCLTPLV